ILELMQGTVRTLLDKNPQLSWETKRSVALQMTKGIAYLHNINGTRYSRESILHQDLKPANLLVSSLNDSPNIQVKITDFGIARQLNKITVPILGTVYKDMGKGEVGGTLQYVAPEIMRDGMHIIDLNADIFSAGIILWEIATTKAPERTKHEILTGTFIEFKLDKRAASKLDTSTMMSRVTNKMQPAYPRSAFFGGIINKCIKVEQDSRMSAEELLNAMQNLTI
ncbi:MAG: protein kinase, partial [Legionellales bacterium]